MWEEDEGVGAHTVMTEKLIKAVGLVVLVIIAASISLDLFA